MPFKKTRRQVLALAISIGVSQFSLAQSGDLTILNVSYDPTRELYQSFNPEFSRYWGSAHETDKIAR